MNKKAKYPQPLYARAVEAYLTEFALRQGLTRADIETGAPEEYPTYTVEPWGHTFTLDDIRIDVDGLRLATGGRIEPKPGDICRWAEYIEDAAYSRAPFMNYSHWLRAHYLGGRNDGRTGEGMD